MINSILIPLKRLILLLMPVAACCLPINARAQKYYFQHYGIKDGLSQSQVTAVCQDNSKQIWASTLAGINCFDGKKFTNYGIEDGLPQNSFYGIVKDKKDQIWTGSTQGLIAFGKKGINSYPFKIKSARVGRQLQCDDHDNIWVLRGNRIFRILKGQLHREIIIADTEEISAIKTNPKGKIFAVVFSKGIYKFENDHWKMVCDLSTRPDIGFIVGLAFNESKPGFFYFATFRNLYSCTDGTVRQEANELLNPQHAGFTCILLDNENGLWLGMDNGACLLKKGMITNFNEKNGFTDLRVFFMYKGADGEIWFGTDGDGLLKYQNNSFLVLDKSQGLDNNVVMSLAKSSSGQVYLGCNGSRLLAYKNGQLTDQFLPATGKNISPRINCLFNDASDNLWIGTDNAGSWIKTGNHYEMIELPPGSSSFTAFTTITDDSDHTVWLASTNGCYYVHQKELARVKGLYTYCTALYPIGKDSMLVGTIEGVKLIVNKMLDVQFECLFSKNQINCMQYHKPFLLVGTNEGGILIYNTQTKKTQRISTQNGLSSNLIYSMLLADDQLWIGTGRGINKYIFTIKNDDLILSLAPVAGIPMECNQNAILKAGNKVWIGSTQGISIYPLSSDRNLDSPPKIVIENIQTYTENSDKLNYVFVNGYRLPSVLSVPSKASHISVEFHAVMFDDSKVLYQYMLDGLDNNYSQPGRNSFVDYPNLPPGNYNFKVRAVSANNIMGTAVSYRFNVTPAFYQTIWFRLLLLLLIVLVVFSAIIYKNYLDKRKLDFIHQLRLQEQENVRMQTAEDFHDDLGNKLTRINMLSELLDKKIPAEQTEQKKLTRQIRTSAVEMYMGTKNILWALNPKNDQLDEVIREIEKFGYAFFDNMNIAFKTTGHDNGLTGIKLPLGHSHNILLIFKELMNNVLKHSEAKTVKFTSSLTSYTQISLILTDDGIGYINNEHGEGNGIRNMINRAKRINGELIIFAAPGKGTIAKLTFIVN